MRIFDKYCNDARKKTQRLLKKMFWYGSIHTAICENSRLKKFMEAVAAKRIEEFTLDDKKKFPYLYAKWLTLDKITSIYVDLVSLESFVVKELEDEFEKLKCESYNNREV